MQLTDNQWRNESPAINNLGAIICPETGVCDPNPFYWQSLIKLYSGKTVLTLSEPRAAIQGRQHQRCRNLLVAV